MAVEKLVILLAAFNGYILLATGKVDFNNLFQFHDTSYKDVMVMTGERINKLDAVSRHSCKTVCVHDSSCFQALYSEVDYSGCTPDNCTRFPARESEGICNLLTKVDTTKPIDLGVELTDSMRHFHLDFPPICRPKVTTKPDENPDPREMVSVRLDPQEANCYIFTYRCNVLYWKTEGDNTVRCCDATVENSWQPLTLKCEKKQV